MSDGNWFGQNPTEFTGRLAGQAFGTAWGTTPIGLLTSPQLWGRFFNQEVTDENRPAGTRSTEDKTLIWDPKNKRWIKDRPEGYGAPLGGKPHVWSTESQEWVPMPGVKIPETKAPEPKEKPSTGAPAAYDPGSGSGSGTGVDPTKGLEGTQPTPQETFDQFKDLRDWLPEVLQQSHQQELQRYALTSALRNQGLDRLNQRDRERETIRAWAAIRTAQEQARSNQAIALAQTAYLAQTPNVALGQMLNEGMKAAITPVQLYAPKA